MKKLVFTNNKKDARTDYELKGELTTFVNDSDEEYFYTANGSIANYLFRALAVKQTKYPISDFVIITHKQDTLVLEPGGCIDYPEEKKDYAMDMIDDALWTMLYSWDEVQS